MIEETGSTFELLVSGPFRAAIELEGLTPGTQYDQLNFDGPVTLNGTLTVLDTTEGDRGSRHLRDAGQGR